MPISHDIVARIRPSWRTVTIEGVGELQVRTPTVAAAARIPAVDWWLPCVRCVDGSAFLPEGVDVRDLDAKIVDRIAVEVMREAERPTQPASADSPV
jgi:hypothetical protein